MQLEKKITLFSIKECNLTAREQVHKRHGPLKLITGVL